jgi:PAS domain S-box-containing protein
MVRKSSNANHKAPDKKKKTPSKAGKASTRAAKPASRLESAFYKLAEAILILDEQGLIQYMNLEAKSMLGEQAGDLHLEDWPQKFNLCLDHRDTPFPVDRLPPALALRGKTVQAQEMILCKNRDVEAQDVWLLIDARPVEGPDGLPQGAIVLIRDITDRKKTELSRERYARRIETFYRLTDLIAASNNDVKQITHSVTRLTSEVLGDLSVVTLLNRDGGKFTINAFHDADPGTTALFQEVVSASDDYPSDQGLAATVIKTGEPLLIPEVSREKLLSSVAPRFADFVRQVNINSVLVVPLAGRSGMLGAINLFRHGNGASYNTADQSFLMEIANRTALAIENCILVDSLRTEIAARISAKEALEASQERFRSIFESSNLGIKVLDQVGTILDTNPAFQSMMGYDKTELAGKNFYDFLYPADVERALEFFNGMKLNAAPDSLFEHRNVNKDGSVIWVRTTFSSVKNGGRDDGPAFIFGILENITEQKQAEAEMAELKKRLQSGMDLERLRVAHELHDGPMQELYSAMYRIKQLGERTEPQFKSALEEVNQDIQRVLQDLRNTAKELRPPAISNFGLEKAIRSHADDFQQAYPEIKLQLSLAQDRQFLPEDVRLALFRVYQQSMMNVVRHAKASQVNVRFSFDVEEVRLEISDNGHGFKVPANWLNFVRQGHYGLAGAAERMNAVGGTLEVISNPPEATVVRAILPLKESSLILPAPNQEPIIRRAKDLI